MRIQAAPKCLQCHKVVYSSRAKARKRLRKSAYKAGCNETYECPYGNGWHLSGWKRRAKK